MVAVRSEHHRAGMSSPFGRDRPLRVVLVDDNADFLAQARRLVEASSALELAGAATSAPAALALLESEPADLVLMDLRLPGMSGLEATSRIKRADGASPKVIILTLYDGAEYRLAAQRADGFLAKADWIGGLARLLDELFAPVESGA
jgi:DNA-binding NarL/FixJ family response regulator